MRYAGRIATALLLGATLFTSCTCHQEVGHPPGTLQAPPPFHVQEPKSEKKVAAAPTATAPMKAPTLPQVAAAQTPEPPPAGMPSDFPKDVPVFNGAALTQVQGLANNAHNVIFSTPAPLPEISQFYQDKMRQAGWKVTQEFSRSNHSFAQFQKGNMVANVTVAEDVHNPGKQVIAIMYEEQKPLDFD